VSFGGLIINNGTENVNRVSDDTWHARARAHTHTHTHTHTALVTCPFSQFCFTHAVCMIHPCILKILTRLGERSASGLGRFAPCETESDTLK